MKEGKQLTFTQQGSIYLIEIQIYSISCITLIAKLHLRSHSSSIFQKIIFLTHEPYSKFNYNAVKKKPGNSVQSDAKLTCIPITKQLGIKLES